MIEDLTIIIPAYNCAATLGDCLNSVLCQTYSRFRVIVIDDGSADRTLEICSKFAALDSRVTVIHQNNRGVSAARNAGLRECSTPYIMFADSDDILVPALCEKLMNAVKTSDGCQMAASGFKRCFYKNGMLKKSCDVLPGTSQAEDKDSCYTRFGRLYENTILTNVYAKVYLSRVIRENHILFQEGLQLAEDVLFNLSYQRFVHKIAFINEPLYQYNQAAGSGSLASQSSEERYRIAAMVYREAGIFCQQHWGRKENSGALQKVFYKDCVNALEKLEWKQRILCARRILKMQVLQDILSEGCCQRPDIFIYWLFFMLKCPVILSSFAGGRKMIKKLLRGFS